MAQGRKESVEEMIILLVLLLRDEEGVDKQSIEAGRE
jgi:hypothetical protein